MIYIDIEDAIVQRLQPLTTQGIDVQATPDAQKELAKTATNPRVTIQYTKSEYGEPYSTTYTEQQETALFQILLEARNLRQEKGILELHELVRVLLLGFRPAGYGRMYMKKSGLVTYDKDTNTWAYMMEFATTVQAIEAGDEETEQVLTRLTLNTYIDPNLNTSSNIPGNHPVPNIEARIYKADGVTTLLEFDGVDGVTTTLVLSQMATEEIDADLQANGQITSLLSQHPARVKRADGIGTVVIIAPDGSVTTRAVIGAMPVSDVEDDLAANEQLTPLLNGHPATIKNTAGTILGTVLPDGVYTAPVSPIKDQNGTIIHNLPATEPYEVVVFSGIADDGSGNYTNSIVDNA